MGQWKMVMLLGKVHVIGWLADCIGCVATSIVFTRSVERIATVTTDGNDMEKMQSNAVGSGSGGPDTNSRGSDRDLVTLR